MLTPTEKLNMPRVNQLKELKNIMGDKSPKANSKKNNQKSAVANSANAKKKQAVADKQSAAKKR